MSVAHSTSPFITIYKINRATDTFTKLANPVTLPTGTGYDTAFSPDGLYMTVSHATSPSITIYKIDRATDTFTKLANPATLPAGQGYGTAFSQDGNYISVVHNATPYVTIYKINRATDTFTKLADPDPASLGSQPPNRSYGTAFSPDGLHMSVAHSDSPYITIYKIDRATDNFTKLTNPATLPTRTVFGTAFSPDGQYMSVGHSDPPYITIYKRYGDQFIKLPNPSSLPANTGFGTTFSPDGLYMSVAHGTSPYITIYKIDKVTDTFTKISDPATLPNGTGYDTAFSPDGMYMTVAHTASPYITIYKIDKATDTFTKLANPSPSITGGAFSKADAVAFSPDGLYMSVAHSTSPFITIYKIDRSTDTFTKLADPSILPSNSGADVAFSPDGLYMSVANGISPNITIYKIDKATDTFTKLTNPATLPTGSSQAVAFSPDGNYMSVGNTFGLWIITYKIDRSTDTFTKLADPATLPTEDVNVIAFSPDGNYMSVGHDRAPFITIYKATGGGQTKLTVRNDATFEGGVIINETVRLKVIETLGDDLLLKGKLVTDNTITVGTFGTATATTVCRSTTGVLSACTSSAIYKTDIADLYSEDESALSDILQLQARQFRWKDSGVLDFGFIAEEVEQVNPLFAQYEADGTLSGVKYTQLTALLTKGVQELAVNVQDLDQRLSVVEQGNLQTLTVAQNATIKGNLFLEGKIIAVGAAPTLEFVSTLTNLPIDSSELQAEITGNDIAGIIQVITQDYTGDPYKLKLVFNNGYEYTPVMTLTPNGREGALLGSYIEDSELDSVYINFINTPTGGKEYKFNYQIIETRTQVAGTTTP
jgi:6-phosphogluconolactonase (cycloisomerase 2 family)